MKWEKPLLSRTRKIENREWIAGACLEVLPLMPVLPDFLIKPFGVERGGLSQVVADRRGGLSFLGRGGETSSSETKPLEAVFLTGNGVATVLYWIMPGLKPQGSLFGWLQKAGQDRIALCL
jgi:hypothetical protein